VSVTMLQCPRCCNPLTVSHCQPPVTSEPSDSAGSCGHHGANKPNIIQYPMYQNCLQPPPPSPAATVASGDLTSSQLLQQVQHVRQEGEEILQQWQHLQIRALQNQIQNAKIEQMMIQSQLLHVTSNTVSLMSSSTPLSPTAHAQSHVSSPTPPSTLDIEKILHVSRVELSQCGWYYGKLSWHQSSELLADTEEGTFLVRDSQDPRFLYSLSLQRCKEGPTSVRISFARGKFSLDADDKIRCLMPQFDSIGSLISHYVSLEKEAQQEQVHACGLDKDSSRPSPNRLIIRQPLYKAPPTLAHSARLAINKRLQNEFSIHNSQEMMKLPPKLLEYLSKYSLSI